MRLEDEVAARLWRVAEDFDAGRAPVEEIVRRGRRHRLHRVIGLFAAVLLLGVALGIPLALLSGIGPRPRERQPGGASAKNGVIAVQAFLEPRGPGLPAGHTVYLINPDGTVRRDVAPDDADHMKPAWSPDGKNLAVVRVERQGDRMDEAIYVMKADGTDLTRVHSTGLRPQSVLQLAWSPDGTQLAFIRMDWRTSGGVIRESDAVMQLVVMDAEGTDVRAVTDGSEQVHSFSWSPDGKQIAYTVRYLATEHRFGHDLYLMNSDGTGVRQLTDNGRSLAPAWSPDGRRIAFLSWEPEGDIIHRDVYIMRTDGTGRTRLTTDPAGEDHPTWSPDGTMILFARYPARGPCKLLVVTPDDTSAPLAGPSPAPTGERLLLSSEDLGGCPSDPSWQPIVDG